MIKITHTYKNNWRTRQFIDLKQLEIFVETAENWRGEITSRDPF